MSIRFLGDIIGKNGHPEERAEKNRKHKVISENMQHEHMQCNEMLPRRAHQKALLCTVNNERSRLSRNV